MRRLFAHRDARLLLVGQTLSFFGDRALYLVLGIWVKSLTGSNAAAGLLFFVLGVPALFAPLAGLLVDRMRRRPLMIAVDLAVGAAVLLLLFVHGRDDVWIIYAVTFLYGVSAILFDSAMSALLTVMIPEDCCPTRTPRCRRSSEALRLIAPLAGAALFAAVGGGAVAVLDAASFLASAACLALLAVKEPKPAPREQHFLAEASMGIQHVRRTVALRRIIGATGVTMLVVGFSETLGFAVVAALGHAPSFLGVILTIQGIGAIAGGVTAARLVRRFGDGRVVGLGTLVFACASLLLTAPTLAIVGPGRRALRRLDLVGRRGLRDVHPAALARATSRAGCTRPRASSSACRRSSRSPPALRSRRWSTTGSCWWSWPWSRPAPARTCSPGASVPPPPTSRRPRAASRRPARCPSSSRARRRSRCRRARRAPADVSLP